MKLSESDWIDQNSGFYRHDPQGFYLAKFHAWRYGEIDMVLPDKDMLDAWEADAISFRKSITESKELF